MPEQAISHYRILEKLGAGGMGEVYLAEDTRLGRRVAVKFLLPDATANEQGHRRLFREARAAATLDHPNICAVYEVGEADGRSFIVMQYVEGETLDALIRRKPPRLSESLALAAQIADALAEAHSRGVVHRDIKPQNIIVTQRAQVKVMDFGLAKVAREGAGVDGEAETQSLLTTPGAIIGTVPYMSPEQLKGEQLDARTDIFSFGVVLYEMLTGRQPFGAEGGAATISAILTREPEPLARYSAACPEELQRIVRKCLAKDRALRYQSARELAIDLAQLRKECEGGSVTAEKVAPRRRRNLPRYALPVAALLILAVVGAGVYWFSTRGRAISAVAVLPFANVNSDPDTEYLSDGMTDNIIERLSQLPGLRVMSHSAVFHYKGRETDVQAIGRELGVEAVLTGRLVKRNDALTINLELVDAKDNSHIWGEQYERKLSDLLAVQREIPLDIAEKLRLRLSGESKERLARAYTEDAQAYELYLKGRYSWETWTLDGQKQAIEYFEEAIKKDPNYALAYAGLADTMLWGRFPGAGLPQKEAHRRGREAAMKALSLDPQLGEAHTALGQVLLYDDWDFAGSERELKRALELNPGYAEGHHAYSHLLLILGRIDESFAESQKFLDFDPVSEAPIGHLCYHYLYARRYDDAIAQCRKDFQLYPDTTQGYTLADAYYHKGMFREASEEYLRAKAQDGVTPDVIAQYRKAYAQSGMNGFYRLWLEELKSKEPDERPADIAEFYARLGEKDQAFEWLEKAYAAHADGMVRLKEELGFDNLRSDPRYADLARRVGLPP